MLIRHVLLILLLSISQVLHGQRLMIDKEIEKVDSLIIYNHFSEAEQEIELLYDWLLKNDKKERYKDVKLRLLLHKAYIFSENGENKKTLEIVLDVIDQAKKHKLPEREYQGCLLAALVNEITQNDDLCKDYLDRAVELYRKNRLDNIYSKYCIRISSYYRYMEKQDSALYFAYRGLDSAQKYQNNIDIADAYLLLGMILYKEDYRESIKYFALAANKFMEISDFNSAADQFNNIAVTLFNQNHIEEAFTYSDSAMFQQKKTNQMGHYSIYKRRSHLFEAVGNIDSAYHYFQEYHDAHWRHLLKTDAAEIKRITEQYEHGKREAVIKSKDQQLIFLVSLFAVIIAATVLLVRKNKEINVKNKVINKQLEELMRTLDQKQVLLSELQHRVKNNLQHVISILELQKESVDFNNIDELIRGNQNRIHSMALLHKKLNLSENVNEVDLKKYVTELSELVKSSYDNHKKKINLNIICEIEKISIEKALPVGLIIVELVSNSMKHAFKKQHIGIINLAVTRDKSAKKNKLYYADNGNGFDFNEESEKGLGQEIIKGLIGQLDGIIESKSTNGFELTIYFK